MGSVRHTNPTKPESKRDPSTQGKMVRALGSSYVTTATAQWMGPLTSYTRLHVLHGQANAHAHRAHVGVSAEGVDVGTRRYEVVYVFYNRKTHRTAHRHAHHKGERI